MKVYSAGFYVDDYTLKRLGGLPGWAGYTPAALQGPDAEALIQSVLDAPAACAVNVSESDQAGSIPLLWCSALQLYVPVRNTDFGHLRDGLTRTLVGRQKMARHRGELTAEDDERLAGAMQQFKAIFPGGSVPKGKSLVLVRSADGHLHVEYEGRVLGKVADKWMADNLIKAYFNTAAPISPPLRDSVAEGFATYV
ncbi:uncharacterized protein COLE_02613 [Cutaneotrichosporon oleaginosum]|nr:hypothetical protein COLE_02613 [Cutaneotrichosporon oleaginosum]